MTTSEVFVGTTTITPAVSDSKVAREASVAGWILIAPRALQRVREKRRSRRYPPDHPTRNSNRVHSDSRHGGPDQRRDPGAESIQARCNRIATPRVRLMWGPPGSPIRGAVNGHDREIMPIDQHGFPLADQYRLVCAPSFNSSHFLLYLDLLLTI